MIVVDLDDVIDASVFELADLAVADRNIEDLTVGLGDRLRTGLGRIGAVDDRRPSTRP